jgi:hypothetical protein
MADTKRPRANTPVPPTDSDAAPPSVRWESQADLATTLPFPPPMKRPVIAPPPPTGDSINPVGKASPGQAIPGGSSAPARDAGVDAAPEQRSLGSGVELFVIDESQPPRGQRKPWRAAEVWTKRRIYGLDSTFKCVEILDRETGRPESSHDMLGARLGGGRLREADTVRFAYPLPLPGMEAMFMKGKKHGYTSAVERMIVRIRVLRTSVDDTLPTWEEIANRWSEPPRDVTEK